MEDDGPPGVPEWVVTYGDMMSLLLTFFIMLVSLSEVVADEKYRAILSAIQQYVGYRTSPLAPPGENYPLNSMIDQIRDLQLGSFTNEHAGMGGIRTQAVAGSDYRVYRTREGKSRRVGKPLFYAPNETGLSDDAKVQLDKIVALLAGKPNKIEIRAHTSDAPLPDDASFSDMFALTYERGKRIAEFLIQRGINQERLRITAAGDNEPPSASVDKRSLGFDRAEILITDAFVSEYVGPRDNPE